jgi:hypothetical protein
MSEIEIIATVFKRFADADRAAEAAQQKTTGHYKYLQSDTDRARASRMRLIMSSIAEALADADPKFNRDNFYRACGL